MGAEHFHAPQARAAECRPTEETERLEMPDPTWVAEYAHFKELCARPAHNLDNDLWINNVFNRVRASLGLPAPQS